MTYPESHCFICGVSDTVSHHTSYEPEVTIEVCSRCHGKIHRKEGFYDELAPDRKRPTGLDSGITTLALRKPDRREQLYESLKDATDENTYSGALDAAADYYLKMAGETSADSEGAVEKLMQLADEQGSVTPAEIADVLDVDELPVAYSSSWAIDPE